MRGEIAGLRGWLYGVLTIDAVPANEVSWDDLQAVFGARGSAALCQCQRYKITGAWWPSLPQEVRTDALREQAACGDPGSGGTNGLVGYLDGTPVGWCAVEPRPAYARLLRMPVPWKERPDEDRGDDSVWAVTCFVTRAGYRRRGVTYAMCAAAVEYARERGAGALEGYPMIVQPGQDVTWDELHVGNRTVFAAAGFRQVSHPTKRRVVMRIDF